MSDLTTMREMLNRAGITYTEGTSLSNSYGFFVSYIILEDDNAFTDMYFKLDDGSLHDIYSYKK